MKSLISTDKPKRSKALPTLYTSVAPDMRGTNRADELLRQMRIGFGYEPLAEMMELRAEAKKRGDLDTRFKIAKELMTYTHAKQRSKEVSPDLQDVFDIQVVTSNSESNLLALVNGVEA